MKSAPRQHAYQSFKEAAEAYQLREGGPPPPCGDVGFYDVIQVLFCFLIRLGVWYIQYSLGLYLNIRVSLSIKKMIEEAKAVASFFINAYIEVKKQGVDAEVNAMEWLQSWQYQLWSPCDENGKRNAPVKLSQKTM
jgi:hypothetical protein